MNNCKNYNAHGGNETVIGGKLTFLPGAQVEGLADLLGLSDLSEGAELLEYTPDAATVDALGCVKAAVNQADSTATTVAGLKEDFNALLAKLRAAGIMVADAPVGE